MVRPRIARTVKARRAPAAPLATPLAFGFPAAAAVVFALALGILLRLVVMDVPQRTPDELYYAYYAVHLSNGEASFASLLQHYSATPAMWQETAPPTRLGYLWLAVGAIGLTGVGSPETLALLSLVSSVVGLFLVMAIALEIGGAPCAALAILLLASSPLDLAIARRGWQDATQAAVTLGVAWAFVGAVRRPPGWVARAVCLALAAYSMLIKETGMVILALAITGLAWEAWPRSRRDAAISVLAGALAGLAAVATLLAVGGVENVVGAYRLLFSSATMNDYMRRYQMGGPGLYVTGLLLTQPVTASLAVVGTALALARPRWLMAEGAADGARRALRGVAGFVLLYALVAAMYSQKNMRFLSPLFGLGCILAAALLLGAWARFAATLVAPARRMGAAVGWVLLLVHAALDVMRFWQGFVVRQIPDLATRWFVGR